MNYKFSRNSGAAQTSPYKHLPFNESICGHYFHIISFASHLDGDNGYNRIYWTCTHETLKELCTRFCSSAKLHGENKLQKIKFCPTEVCLIYLVFLEDNLHFQPSHSHSEGF